MSSTRAPLPPSLLLQNQQLSHNSILVHGTSTGPSLYTSTIWKAAPSSWRPSSHPSTSTQSRHRAHGFFATLPQQPFCPARPPLLVGQVHAYATRYARSSKSFRQRSISTKTPLQISSRSFMSNLVSRRHRES